MFHFKVDIQKKFAISEKTMRNYKYFFVTTIPNNKYFCFVLKNKRYV